LAYSVAIEHERQKGDGVGERSWRGVVAVIAVVTGMLASFGAMARPDMANSASRPIGRIAWAQLDFSPFQIVGGGYQGSGSFDGLHDLLVREIRDAEHESVQMTFARREEEFRDGEPLCSPGMFRTPVRERYLVFSNPALIHLDNRLVFLSKNAGRFPPGSTVDLEALLENRKLIGGVISGRSFAPNIDAAIRRNGGSNLATRPLKASQIVELLISGEIDYTIMFSHEAAYVERQLGREGLLANRQIAGTPPYILTHVACTRGEWGEQVIARVNRVLRGQRNRPEYRALSERWYSESDRALVRLYYPRLLYTEAAGPR
jgi:uncharacterized protein (TIGR02285 family)